MYRCVVKGCPANGTHPLSFFKLPKELTEPWMNVIGRGVDFISKPSQRICELHFSAENLKPNLRVKRLIKNAVPSMNPDVKNINRGNFIVNIHV